MKIVIKATNIELNQALKDYIEEKINDLERFLEVFEEETYYNGFFGKGKPRVEAWVEVGRTTFHHQKGQVFRAEVQMHLPKKSIRAEAIADDLKLAVVEVKDELQRQLKKYKNKISVKEKRRTRIFKRLLHLSPLARFRKRKGERTREEGI